MKQEKKKPISKKSRNRRTAGVIAAVAAAVLVSAFLVILLFGPMLVAGSVFFNAMEATEAYNGTLVLTCPYVEGAPLPDSVEVTLEGKESDAMMELFRKAFSSHRYVETTGMSGAKLWPYLSVKGESVVFFYLEEDSVWVEKNSTFYRFRPGTSEGETAYAEFYKTVTDHLSENAGE